MSQSQLLFLELNEVNFDYVARYGERGFLKNFASLSARYGISKTTSETRYENLEPWIQWVTAHTGQTLAEHRIFRLGDIVKADIPQIWEILEERGLRVGAISPMNAKNRLRSPAFFVPDPWTPTTATTTPLLRRLMGAVSQVVNDNAQSKLTAASALWLLIGAMRHARVENYALYAHLALNARSRPWYKAMFLDLLLADIFIGSTRRSKPHFATLFLNAAAHIQHHYLFSSGCYRGPHRNPEWYLKKGLDPVLDVYDLYDRIVGQVIRAFPQARVMMATGLHQDPHEEITYYWRLKEHGHFLREAGVDFRKVETRMSRDFVVYCDSTAAAERAAERLTTIVANDGVRLFEVDNRGTDLFVMLTYPREVNSATRFSVAGGEWRELATKVAFVALKNGQHNGDGYFLDTGSSNPSVNQETFPLKDLPNRILSSVLPLNA